MGKRKQLASSGRTRDLLNHGPGKGDKDRTTNLIAFAKNRAGIRGMRKTAIGFRKVYGLERGSMKRNGPVDKVKVDRTKKAWQKYQAEYEMLQRDCHAMNQEAGVSDDGHPL
jgi:hypothetical protein